MLLLDAFMGWRQFSVTNRREINEFLNIPALENVKVNTPNFRRDNNEDDEDFERHYWVSNDKYEWYTNKLEK